MSPYLLSAPPDLFDSQNWTQEYNDVVLSVLLASMTSGCEKIDEVCVCVCVCVYVRVHVHGCMCVRVLVCV